MQWVSSLSIGVFRKPTQVPKVRAKRLVTKPSVISKKKKHLSSALVANGYSSSFVQRVIKARAPTASTEPLAEFRSTSVLPYTKDLSEQFYPITAWQSHLFYNMFYANFN